MGTAEPVIGWRIWKLRGDHLDSWAVDHTWHPGENVAGCLAAGRPRCGSSPGQRCQCGFWALRSPVDCASRAASAWEPPWHVMGLIVGWGTVALHGREGFRAERAAVLCLFADRPWTAPAGAPRWLGTWCRRMLRLSDPFEQEDGDPALEAGHMQALEAVAARYGVPVLSLGGAARFGVLGEMGVPPAQVREAARLARGAAE